MKQRITLIVFLFSLTLVPRAQSFQKSMQAGIKAYRFQDFGQAERHFRASIRRSPQDATGYFNLGNTLFRANDAAGAEAQFDAATGLAKDDRQRAAAFYNKGVAASAQQKLEASIFSYKQALRLNPADTLARENLVLALRQQQRRQKEEAEKKKDEKQNPASRPPTLNRQQMQQLLEALREQEKKLRQKGQQKIPAPDQQEKDW